MSRGFSLDYLRSLNPVEFLQSFPGDSFRGRFENDVSSRKLKALESFLISFSLH